MGNVVANSVTASIEGGSVVTAAGDITITAKDIAPSIIPDWIVPADRADDLTKALDGTPVDLDANILSVMVSVAASGSVAVNAALVGNIIANNVTAEISGSDVESTGGLIDLDALSKAGIIGLTVGVAGSGSVAVNATGYGNVITNRIESSVTGGSHVTADDLIDITAMDSSQIRSLGISVAGSGAVSAGALLAANVVANTVIANIAGSTVESGSTLNIEAENNSDILGLTAGVAGSGAASVLLSLSANVISNTTEAGITSGAGLFMSLHLMMQLLTTRKRILFRLTR
jgi:hypothetical protein